jgi:nicotinamidase/pyrazinamidase
VLLCSLLYFLHFAFYFVNMKALLLIDIQNDFLPGGSLAVPDGDRIIPLVNDMQHAFGLVVATQDWHPQAHKSFASSHEDKAVFEQIQLYGLPQVLWPDHCVQETSGAELSQAVDWKRTEAIFRKGTDPAIDSYSGFYDNGHLKSTGLAAYLRGRGVTAVYLAGLAGDYCVYFTAKDALAEGFDTYVIGDATRPIDKKGFQRAMMDILDRGGSVIRSAEV